MPIEEWISDPIASERHQRFVRATPERTVELALELPAGGDGVVGALTRLRGMKSGGTMEEFLANNGFVFLSREPREVVVGIGARADLFGDKGMLADAADWRGWNQPNSVKAAATFRAVPDGDGSVLVTETQVAATDEQARRRFRVYWTAIRPFSALIRHRWLRQIARRAERDTLAATGA
jgi:hypothetical protein